MCSRAQSQSRATTNLSSWCCIAFGGCLLFTSAVGCATEYHVATTGNDADRGTRASPLRTIQAAANRAQPGDLVTVHAGVYRERISPPRGGTSDSKRIVYQAARGESVEIKGSELITNWVRVQSDVWKAVLPNSFFGSFNPYQDLIHGDWFAARGRQHHTGAVYLNGVWLTEAAKLEEVLQPVGESPLWFAQVEAHQTTIWAQFKGCNPNEQLVEINVRQTVFYPEQAGVNYLTVRGFQLRHAATPWAPPTAEQIGLIGTHWSRGWIIEANEISHSTCSGIALGKYGDEWDNKSANSATGYVHTIQRALQHGWNKENIGHHVVRNNTISHCEQTGIVGSLGAAFSVVTGNTIHDIHVRRLFSGAEMAGIKFHGAIDVEISRNHIYRTCRGLWLDWMAQGTRVSRNLFHDNQNEDLFVEVDHGPFVVDNNLFLSLRTLLDVSRGGAYVHNLIAGEINVHLFDGRLTPYHQPHSTTLAGFTNNSCGDDRYLNNLLVQQGNLSKYDDARLPMHIAGNLFLQGTKPSKHEALPQLKPEFDPELRLVEQADGFYLTGRFDPSWRAEQKRGLVTATLLGRAIIPDLPYENADGSPVRFDTDYLGSKRRTRDPFPGPFEIRKAGSQTIKVWPVENR